MIFREKCICYWLNLEYVVNDGQIYKTLLTLKKENANVKGIQDRNLPFCDPKRKL